MSYPGGKGNSFRHIINLMPPHETYIEPFLGGGSVFHHKRMATNNILNDIDPKVIKKWEKIKNTSLSAAITLFNVDGIHFIRSYKVDKNTLIYCDPPYLPETRKSGRIYDYELSRSSHVTLIDVIKNLPCMVMISGYPCKLYDDALSSWSRLEYSTVVRSGASVQECLWYNFKNTSRLHDYSYVGSDFRERDLLNRQKRRMINHYKNMTPTHRLFLFEALCSAYEYDIKFLLNRFKK